MPDEAVNGNIDFKDYDSNGDKNYRLGLCYLCWLCAIYGWK